MRTAGAVYKKLKEVKYRHLVNLYKKCMKRLPPNCKYNYPYFFTDSDGCRREIRLCLFNQEESSLSGGIKSQLLDVCEQPRHYQQCNAFVYKYSKEDIRALFESEMKDKELKAAKYPEICALEWVLDRFSYETGLLKKIKNLFNQKNKTKEMV